MSITPGYSKTNACITNGKIHNSSIDMGGGVITNHSTPINPTDVVNKDYADNLQSNLPFIVVTLSSTFYTSILNTFKGNYTIIITNIIENGPCATFSISKRNPNKLSSYIRTSSDAGETTLERLDIRWNANSPIELHKTGLNYDGDYKIVYIENN